MAEQHNSPWSIFRWVRTNRNVITFWFLGLANNYGYVVMLSAAHDILAAIDQQDQSGKTNFKRECNTMSTGIILLADIMPSILVKILSPFFPLCINLRMTIAILLSMLGFVLVAVKTHQWVIIFGVVCTSLSCGLGESSLLSYVVFFPTANVISTWSSGTGGAGIVGSLSYAGLTTLGLSPTATMLIMLTVPVLEAFSFFLFLDHPNISSTPVETVDNSVPTVADILTLREKFKIIPYLLITFMIPFGMVYLFEYTINQGLYELLYFPNSFLSHSEQYRWYNVLYQVGVFVSRSSMNVVHIKHVWFIAFLQFLNIVFCFFEVIFGLIHHLPLLMVLIFWEGMVGGASYVNTYRRIATEMPPETRQFSMAMNSFADVLMITCAGLIAHPTHDYVCANFPSPYQ